eukprot:jgi/Psemu1/316961/fgenesh1_kg.4847_\
MEIRFDTTTVLIPTTTSATTTTTPFVVEAEDEAAAASPTGRNLCLKCHKKPMTYECDPCGCPSFCTDCAMKLASGGRCKTCHDMYGGMRRIRN